MRKELYLPILLVSTICIAGCGKKTPDLEAASNATDIPAVTKEVETEITAEPTVNPTEDAEESVANISDVYPTATGITDIAMGISEDMCTFKVPLNYVLAGGSYGEDGKEKTIAGLNSATTTVEDALAAGSFSTGEHLAFFTMTSLDDDTMLTASLGTSDLMAWDDYKTTYPDAKEIGDENIPALVYHVERISGNSLAIAIHVNEDVTLQIVYEGNAGETVGEDQLAQDLYGLITVL